MLGFSDFRSLWGRVGVVSFCVSDVWYAGCCCDNVRFCGVGAFIIVSTSGGEVFGVFMSVSVCGVVACVGVVGFA